MFFLLATFQFSLSRRVRRPTVGVNADFIIYLLVVLFNSFGPSIVENWYSCSDPWFNCCCSSDVLLNRPKSSALSFIWRLWLCPLTTSQEDIVTFRRCWFHSRTTHYSVSWFVRRMCMPKLPRYSVVTCVPTARPTSSYQCDNYNSKNDSDINR